MKYKEINRVIDGEGLSDPMVRTLRELYKVLYRKYGKPIGMGRRRVSFANEKYVFKLPRKFEGFGDNTTEYRLFSEKEEDGYDLLPLARCKLLFIKDVPILVMERLDLKLSKEETPEWADWIDSQQVGRNRGGEVVAYDYAGG